jgi:hypothetical protein
MRLTLSAVARDACAIALIAGFGVCHSVAAQALPVWIALPSSVPPFTKTELPPDGASYEMVARYVHGNTTADVFLSALPPSPLPPEDLVLNQVRALAAALPSMYSDFALGTIVAREAVVRSEKLPGAVMVGAIRRGVDIMPTHAFLYAVRDRLLEIRVTGGEPSDNVLAFVDALLPKMIQPAATH